MCLGNTLRSFSLVLVMLTYDDQFNTLVRAALKEDIGPGDYSTLCCIPAGVSARAILKIKQEGILAGTSAAEKILRHVQPSVNFVSHKKDGDAVQPGDI